MHNIHATQVRWPKISSLLADKQIIIDQSITHIPNKDVDIALRCGRLHVPDPRSEWNALIAATALVHNMTVVTRNVADFKGVGVQLLNP